MECPDGQLYVVVSQELAVQPVGTAAAPPVGSRALCSPIECRTQESAGAETGNSTGQLVCQISVDGVIVIAMTNYDLLMCTKVDAD